MDSLISQGLSLMIYGMGFVFVFLTLLVLMTTLMSTLVTKYGPAPVAPSTRKKRVINSPIATQASYKSDDELVAVITAAVHQYRS